MNDIKKGDIVRLKGTTLYSVESEPIDYKPNNYVTIQNLVTGRTATKQLSQLTLVKRLESLINTRLNGINLTNDRRRIVGDISKLKQD